MEHQQSPFEGLLDRVKSYVETRIDLIKLKAVDKASGIISNVVATTVVVVFAFLFFLLLNIGIALLLGDLLGKSYYGFFIVAGFYGITGLVLHFKKDKMVKRPVSDAIIKNMLD
jgi:hypothetical protein